MPSEEITVNLETVPVEVSVAITTGGATGPQGPPGSGESMTASEILTEIKTVDGGGSGLDADLLDGLEGSAYATAAQGTLAASAVQPATTIRLGSVPQIVPSVHASGWIDRSIDGQTAPHDLWSTVDHSGAGTYAVNASSWPALAGIDLTGIAVYNSATTTYGNQGACVAISPLHGVMAHHYATSWANGTELRWVTSSGVTVTRTIVDSSQVGATDIRVVEFSSALPSTIAPVALMPEDYTAFIPSGTAVLTTDQDRQALVSDLASATAIEEGAGDRAAWHEDWVAGDSGSPVLVIIDGAAVWIGSAASAPSGFSAGLGNTDDLLAAAASLNAGATPVVIALPPVQSIPWDNLSGVPSLGVPVSSDPVWDAAGDLIVGTGADAAGRLAMGSASQILRVNSGATALEWATLSGTGDVTGPASSVDGAIPKFSGTGGKTLVASGAVHYSGSGELSNAGRVSSTVGGKSIQLDADNLRITLTDLFGLGSRVFSLTGVGDVVFPATAGTLALTTTNFAASQITSGTLDDVRIPSGITRDSEWNTAAKINTNISPEAFVIVGGDAGTPSDIDLANASNVPATNINGVIPIANLATGTPDGTKFIRDDGTLQAVGGGTPEGTAILSTGETGGSKFLREDGDGTSSWQAITGGGDALTSSPLSQFAATTSAQLRGVLSDELGTGAALFDGATPTSLTLTNATGLPASGIGSGTLVHERGGLEADVSAYSGLVRITGGATSAVATSEGGNGAADSGKVPTFDASGHLAMRNSYHVNGNDELVVNPNGSISYINSSGTPVSATLNLSNAQGQELTISAAGGEIVVLTGAQTLEDKTISGADNTITNLSAANIASGTLAVARGGTGAGTLTANNVLLGNGTSALQAVAPGTSGNVLTSNGTTWQSTAPSGGGGASANYKRVTSDQTFSSTSLADVTDMNFAVAANTAYRFEFLLRIVSSTASEAPRFGINGPASPVQLLCDSRWNYSSTAEVQEELSAYDAVSANTQGTTAGGLYILRGIFINGANAGTLTARGRAELGGANSVDVKTGSIVTWSVIAP